MRVTIPVHLAAALTKEKLKQLNQYTLFSSCIPNQRSSKKQARSIVNSLKVHKKKKEAFFYFNSIYL